nr:type II toxin-antitoxin system CcdA family antitoxin [uncultured Methanospirillum sp.]
MRTVTDAHGAEFKPTNVLIPVQIHKKARSLGLNMSQICSTALSNEVAALEAQSPAL